MRQSEIALFEFVESGEHIEADKYHPGLKEKAERLCQALAQRDSNGKEGLRRANAERAFPAEQRRQWIAANCKDFVFDRSRKRGIANIQGSLRAAGMTVPSEKRLYADIDAIRKGWHVIYFSQAKDKP